MNSIEANRPYQPNRNKIAQLFVAGLVASVAMTTFAYLLRAVGIAAPDFAAVYGSILNGQSVPLAFTGMWWSGLIWHLFNGTAIFSMLFDYFVDRRVLPQDRWAKGFVWGASLWLFTEIIVYPMAGIGAFARLIPSSFLYSLTTLLAFSIYGLALDGMSRVPAVHQIQMNRRRAA